MPNVVPHPDDPSKIKVTGPALVSVDGGADYEVATSLTLNFPATAHVWLKAWPKPEEAE